MFGDKFTNISKLYNVNVPYVLERIEFQSSFLLQVT